MNRLKRLALSACAACGVILTAASLARAASPLLPIPPAGPANAGGNGGTAVKVSDRLAALKEKALGADPAASLAAIRELKSMGQPARPTAIVVLRTVLTRDQQAVAAAVKGVGDRRAADAFAAQLEALRAQARANVPLLDKADPSTTRRAHEFYDQLVPMTAKMNQAWALRTAVIDAMGRRPELLQMWRETASPVDRSFAADAEARLKADADAAVGDFAERAAAMAWDAPPEDANLRPLWFFVMCRKVEAFNAARAAKFMDAEEAKNFACVNVYREALGLMPFEADERLVQAARRHSKEMVDKNYFAHESPTESEREPIARMRNAGYDTPTAGENIATGAHGGEKAFWVWFDSPGHHKNMARETYAAMGVGRWHDRYTQNFGGGLPRVMLMSDVEAAAIKVGGAPLAPDPSGAGVKK
jgi:uncharacterized protein YkwD